MCYLYLLVLLMLFVWLIIYFVGMLMILWLRYLFIYVFSSSWVIIINSCLIEENNNKTIPNYNIHTKLLSFITHLFPALLILLPYTSPSYIPNYEFVRYCPGPGLFTEDFIHSSNLVTLAAPSNLAFVPPLWFDIKYLPTFDKLVGF